MKTRQVYLDNAAMTPADPGVIKIANEIEKMNFGNPSSIHEKGRIAKDILDNSRKVVSDSINAHSDEIVFCSSGTESDNLAILGIAHAHQDHGKHIISSKIEHPAVLEALNELEKQGFEITLLDVDEKGLISASDVVDAIRLDTILVTIMHANNEIGTIQPIEEIGREILKIRKKQKTNYPYFHSDACQTFGYLDLNVEKMHVDLMTFNSTKIYGPKGVAALCLKRGTKIRSLIFGGHQEKRIRPGTENVSAIAGFAKAIQISDKKKKKENRRQEKLRDYFVSELRERVSKIRVNGDLDKRLPNNINISFLDIEGEALLLYLDAKGIFVSSGSACSSEKLDPSHVIMSLGVPHAVAHGSIRFSLGRWTTKKDLKYVLDVLPGIVEDLRKISSVTVDDKYAE